MTTRISVDLPADLLEAANLNQYRNRTRLATRENGSKFKQDALKQVELLPAKDKKDLYKGAVPEYTRKFSLPSGAKDRIAWMIVWHDLNGSFIQDTNLQPGGSISGTSTATIATSALIGDKALSDTRYFEDVNNLSFLLIEKEPYSNQWNDTSAAYECAYLGDIPPLGSQPIFFPSTDLFNRYFDPSYYTEAQLKNLTFYGIEQLSNRTNENSHTSIYANSERIDRLQLDISSELYERKEVRYDGVGTVPDCLGGSPYSVYLYGIKHLIKASYGSVFLSLAKVTSKKYLYLSWRNVSPNDVVMDAHDYSASVSSIPLNASTGQQPGYRSIQLVKRLTATGSSYNETQQELSEWIRGNIVEVYKIEPSRHAITDELILPSIIEVLIAPRQPISLKNNFPYQPNYPENGINSTIDMPFAKNSMNGQLRIFISGRNYAAT